MPYSVNAFRFSLAAPDGTPFDQVAKPGRFIKDGEECVFDETTLGQFVANFAAQKNPLPADVEHQLCYSSENGKPVPLAARYDTLALVMGGKLAKYHSQSGAPAPDVAGWADGLYARRAEVTPFGRDLIENGGYGYVSPTFQTDGLNEQGEPIGYSLLTASWVVLPFLDGMEPVTFHRLNHGATAPHAMRADDNVRCPVCKGWAPIKFSAGAWKLALHPDGGPECKGSGRTDWTAFDKKEPTTMAALSDFHPGVRVVQIYKGRKLHGVVTGIVNGQWLQIRWDDGSESRAVHYTNVEPTGGSTNSPSSSPSPSLPPPGSRWGANGVRYDEPCARCRRATTIDNMTEICESCAKRYGNRRYSATTSGARRFNKESKMDDTAMLAKLGLAEGCSPEEMKAAMKKFMEDADAAKMADEPPPPPVAMMDDEDPAKFDQTHPISSPEGQAQNAAIHIKTGNVHDEGGRKKASLSLDDARTLSAMAAEIGVPATLAAVRAAVVPMSRYTALEQRLAAVEAERAAEKQRVVDAQIADLADRAVRFGYPSEQVEAFRKFARADIEGASKFLETLPGAKALGRMTSGGAPIGTRSGASQVDGPAPNANGVVKLGRDLSAAIRQFRAAHPSVSYEQAAAEVARTRPELAQSYLAGR